METENPDAIIPPESRITPSQEAVLVPKFEEAVSSAAGAFDFSPSQVPRKTILTADGNGNDGGSSDAAIVSPVVFSSPPRDEPDAGVEPPPPTEEPPLEGSQLLPPTEEGQPAHKEGTPVEPEKVVSPRKDVDAGVVTPPGTQAGTVSQDSVDLASGLVTQVWSPVQGLPGSLHLLSLSEDAQSASPPPAPATDPQGAPDDLRPDDHPQLDDHPAPAAAETPQRPVDHPASSPAPAPQEPASPSEEFYSPNGGNMSSAQSPTVVPASQPSVSQSPNVPRSAPLPNHSEPQESPVVAQRPRSPSPVVTRSPPSSPMVQAGDRSEAGGFTASRQEQRFSPSPSTGCGRPGCEGHGTPAAERAKKVTTRRSPSPSNRPGTSKPSSPEPEPDSDPRSGSSSPGRGLELVVPDSQPVATQPYVRDRSSPKISAAILGSPNVTVRRPRRARPVTPEAVSKDVDPDLELRRVLSNPHLFTATELVTVVAARLNNTAPEKRPILDELVSRTQKKRRFGSTTRRLETLYGDAEGSSDGATTVKQGQKRKRKQQPERAPRREPMTLSEIIKGLVGEVQVEERRDHGFPEFIAALKRAGYSWPPFTD